MIFLLWLMIDIDIDITTPVIVHARQKGSKLPITLPHHHLPQKHRTADSTFVLKPYYEVSGSWQPPGGHRLLLRPALCRGLQCFVFLCPTACHRPRPHPLHPDRRAAGGGARSQTWGAEPRASQRRRRVAPAAAVGGRHLSRRRPAWGQKWLREAAVRFFKISP